MIRVAVADDHQLYRKGLAALVAETPDIRLAFDAASGQELLDGLQQHKTDVVLLDVRLQQTDGLELAREIRRAFQDSIRMVVLAMYPDEESVQRMIRGGASGYVLKDTPFDELCNAIRTVHANGYYFNQLLSADKLRSLVMDGHSRPLFPNDIHLSDREREVLQLICQQYTNNEIANLLNLSSSTVHGYRNSLLIKTGAKNTAGLVMFAVNNGLI